MPENPTTQPTAPTQPTTPKTQPANPRRQPRVTTTHTLDLHNGTTAQDLIAALQDLPPNARLTITAHKGHPQDPRDNDWAKLKWREQ